MLANLVVECGGTRWLIREAESKAAAENAISMARVSGSIGHRDVLDATCIGGGVTVLADVVQINSDGTERKPYTRAY